MDAPTRTVAMARRLRREMTLPEVLLWTAIRGGQIDGFRFRRQHPIGPYVLDFYCAATNLALEVDGAAHNQPDQIRHDRVRDEWLTAHGVRVLRLPAKYVLDDMDGVCRTIQAASRG
jgi:very-short-patch-repair endonuclease